MTAAGDIGAGKVGAGKVGAGEVVLREPLDRPRLLRIAIRGECAPVGGPEVAQGVLAQVEGGVMFAGPPLRPFHTVEMWAGAGRNAVCVGCVPTRAGAAVEIRSLAEVAGPGTAGPDTADPDRADAGTTGPGVAGASGAVEVHRYGDLVTLSCRPTAPAGAQLVVDVLWEDR